MKKLFFAIALVLSVSKIYGTAQSPDAIIYNGKKYMLHSNPLELYFENNKDKRPRGNVMSSANWRGYTATFEIVDSVLYVKSIEVVKAVKYTKDGGAKDIYKNVINEVFPNQKKIKVDWLTGLLILPYGKMVSSVYMGYASTYENYIILEIKEGKLIKEKKLTGQEYENLKEAKFQAFKQTQRYQDIIKDMIEEDKKHKEMFKDDEDEIEMDFSDEFTEICIRLIYVSEYMSTIFE